MKGLILRLLLINVVLLLVGCPAFKVCMSSQPVDEAREQTAYHGEGQRNGK